MNSKDRNYQNTNRYREKLKKMPKNKNHRGNQSIIKREETNLPDRFDQNIIISRLEELRSQPTLRNKYFFRLKEKFTSAQEILMIEQWERQIRANIQLVNTMTDAEKAKAVYYKTKRQQEIIDIEVEKEKSFIIAKKEADIKEEEARAAEAEAKIAEARARASKAGQPEKREKKGKREKKESEHEKLERDIREKAQTIRIKSQEIDVKLTALAEMEKKIRIQLAGDEEMIEKYVDIAKSIVFRDPTV